MINLNVNDFKKFDVDPYNYAAICYLEFQGNLKPTQSEINAAEEEIKTRQLNSFYFNAQNEWRVQRP